MKNTNNVTMTPGHYSSTDRVFTTSRLPDLFTNNWLATSISSLDKALDFPSAVYPYDVNLIKNDKGEDVQYEVEVALAGVGRENIDVRVKDSILNIDIKNQNCESKDSVIGLRKGISNRSAKISFSLGQKIQKKKISSSYIDGLLRVVIPVMQPETLDIEIKVM